MEKSSKKRLGFTMLLIQDPNDKGYTAFFAEYPNVVVEGDTRDEAKEKLFSVMTTVLQHKKNESIKQKSSEGYYNIERIDYKVELEPA